MYCNLEWMGKPFMRPGDTPEQRRQKSFISMVMVSTLCLAVMYMFWLLCFRGTDLTIFRELWLVCNCLGLIATVLIICLYLYLCGVTIFLKLFIIFGGCLFLLSQSIVSSVEPWFFSIVVLLDFTCVLETTHDAHIMYWASLALRVYHVLYIGVHVWGEAHGRSIHLDSSSAYPILTYSITALVPVFLNHELMNGFVQSATREAQNLNEAVDIAYLVAEQLANYDLASAEELLAGIDDKSSGVTRISKPLSHLLRNLQSYRGFLPDALFSRVSSDEGDFPANSNIVEALVGLSTSWDAAYDAVYKLRDSNYTLLAFEEDITKAFGELRLYTMEVRGVSDGTSSGRTNEEEYQRTMGAFFALYCLARVDLDGKEVFSFGVNASHKPFNDEIQDANKKLEFYNKMPWDACTELLIRANLLYHCDEGSIRVNSHRMLSFLVLTAFHDIMKNNALLPTVLPRHAPYHGIGQNEVIHDHDIALSYILEHFPGLLPSFRGLEAGQRAPILFTQSKMSFNNGWLVQGEAPPGPLFSNFKQCVTQGRATEADINFYFVHWLTDIAGAEPYQNRLWPGAEKFTVKFPVRVLTAFLESFSCVEKLSTHSEVEVMEEYLERRWVALGLSEIFRAELSEVAAKRIALMAQGFEAEAVYAFGDLPPSEQEVLAVELARTGHKLQFRGAPSVVTAEPAGPALLVYYAPALVQRAGVEEIRRALLLLAAILRAARQLFPVSTRDTIVESTAYIYVGTVKAFSPAQIHNTAPWHLQRTGAFSAEVKRGLAPMPPDDGNDFVPLLLYNKIGDDDRYYYI